MYLEKVPRGREGARSLDAPPVAHPHGPSHIATQLHPHGYEPPPQQLDSWVGWKATDEFGRAVGRIEGLVGNEWLIVRDRRGHHFLVPAADAIAGGASVFLPYEHDLIVTAPQVRSFDEVEPTAIAAAREHYAGALTPTH